MSTKIKIILTGATGMVGEGVLFECLQNPAVAEILVINRKPGGVSHTKLKEVIHPDFFDLTAIGKDLAGFDACFFCLGISSVGIGQEEYKHITYNLTVNFANMLAVLNPDLTFIYVSGAGTDSTEKGRVAWARIKGATENTLMRLFKKSYMFRPGFMKPWPDQKNVNKYYKYIGWFYPIGRRVFPGAFCSLVEVGKAMIHCATKGCQKQIIDVKDIVALSKF